MTSTVQPVEYEDADDEVRAIYDDILESRGGERVPNFWRTIANHPPLLKRMWSSVKEVMAAGALDPLTKEMIAIAVSATNGCEYCVRSHTMAARNRGMSDQMLGELMNVVGVFNETNKIVEGYRVEPDTMFFEKTGS